MRIRQSSSGPFSGRSIDKLSVVYLAAPFVTASLAPIVIPGLAFQANLKPGDKLLTFGVALNVAIDVAGTTTIQIDVVKPDGSSAPFTIPSGIVSLTNVFAAPGASDQFAGPLEYVVGESGLHSIRFRAFTTAGNLTVALGANYIGLAL